MNLLIVRNNSNSQAIDASLLLATYLGTQGIGYAIFDSSDLEGLDPNPLVSQQLARGVDLAVVLGGDGTILRTADAFDCDGVFIVNACADPYSPKTARATMGAVFMTSPCRPGQPKLRFAPGTAFRMLLNCGRPQKNTNTASTM